MGCPEKLCAAVNLCLQVPGRVQGLAGQGLGQPGLKEGAPDHSVIFKVFATHTILG